MCGDMRTHFAGDHISPLCGKNKKKVVVIVGWDEAVLLPLLLLLLLGSGPHTPHTGCGATSVEHRGFKVDHICTFLLKTAYVGVFGTYPLQHIPLIIYII